MFGDKKRGQSNEGGLLIWIIVAIIAAVVVILFFTGGFNVFSSIFKQAPQTLETATQACKLVASPDTRASYCDQWRELDIAGQTQQVNCQYPAIESKLDLGSKIDCPALATGSGSLTFTEKGKEYCLLLAKSGKATEKTKVNDVKCSDLSCTIDYKGTLKPSKDATGKNSECDVGKARLTNGFTEAKDQICCVA